jgi:hypothetical protein
MRSLVELGILASMAPFAVSTGIQVVYAVGLVIVIFLGPVTVAELKGHDFLVGFGWLTLGVTWWIAALKLARPESWWARHLYGPRKLARAEARYADNPFT